MYDESDLKDLRGYIRTRHGELSKKEPGGAPTPLPFTPPGDPPPTTPLEDLEELGKLLEVIHYSPLLFQDVMEQYHIEKVLTEPLDQVPLYISENGLVSKTLMEWRLERGV